VSKRLARFSEQLRRELSELIRLQVRDPRVGPVTITGVEVSGDLGVARVFVRSVAGGEDLARSLEGLEAAAPFLRTSLGRILHVRRVPELRFREDRSYTGAQRIEAVLADVLPSDEASDEAADQAADEVADEVDEPGPAATRPASAPAEADRENEGVDPGSDEDDPDGPDPLVGKGTGDQGG
jgi:ribosome-binding factor A